MFIDPTRFENGPAPFRSEMSRAQRGDENRDGTRYYKHFVPTEPGLTKLSSVSFNLCIQINLLRLADYKSER